MEAKHLSSGANGSYNQFFDTVAALHVIVSTVIQDETLMTNMFDFGVQDLVNFLIIHMSNE